MNAAAKGGYVISLSPLNFNGLIATSKGLMSDLPEGHPAQKTRTAIECYRCPACRQVFDDEDQAIECCKDEDFLVGVNMCPVCTSNATDPRAATNCCLWKDLDAATRYALADRVANGEPWAVVLGVAS